MMADNSRSPETEAAQRKTPVLRTPPVQPQARILLGDFIQEVHLLLRERSVGIDPLLTAAQRLVDEIFPESGASLLAAAEHAEKQQLLEQTFDTIEDLLEAFTLPARKQA